MIASTSAPPAFELSPVEILPLSLTSLDAPSPLPSPLTSLFSRARSNSFHSPSTLFSQTPKRNQTLPPLPTIPPMPLTFTSPSSSPLALSSGNIPRRPNEKAHPYIKSASVPTHSKLNGRWCFGVRIVPDVREQEQSGIDDDIKSLLRNLGRMEMAGEGKDGRLVPHMVWRTWAEFLAFSESVTAAFPTVPSPTSPSSETFPAALPSSFYRQPPRLLKKSLYFVTKAWLVQRQDDLDVFVRRLFDMPDVVRQSELVCSFFRMRHEDALSTPTTPTGTPNLSSGQEEFFNVPPFDSETPISPNATVRAPSAKSKGKRPGLSLRGKKSSPDLRKLMLSDDLDGAFDSPLYRPVLGDRATTFDADNLRTVDSSLSESAASVATVTTSDFPPTPTSRLPSPLSTKSSSPVRSPFASDEKDLKPLPLLIKKRSFGALRHFRSLQDLRHSHTTSDPTPIIPPLPLPTSQPMARAKTNPSKPPPIVTSRLPLNGPASAPNYRARSGSKSSSGSSFEDGGLSPVHSVASGSVGSFFRQGPSGKLDRVPERTFSIYTPHRRPSMPIRSSSTRKVRGDHSPSASISSVDSLRSSTTSSWNPSRRSSTEISDVGSLASTPHVQPQLLDSIIMAAANQDNPGKFFVENGQLTKNNVVPAPPFFPVPPSMASVGYSQESLPRMPSSRPSIDSRPRGSFSSSSFRISESTAASSNRSCSASTTASHASSQRLTPRADCSIFKVLHPDANIVLRVPKIGLTLVELRQQIERKMAQVGVELPTAVGSEWSMIYGGAKGRVSGASTDETAGLVERIDSEEEFKLALERTVHLEKVSLRIV